MGNEDSSRFVEQRVAKALNTVLESHPALMNVVNAFRDLLMERALLKAEYGQDLTVAWPDIDEERFRQGVPVAGLTTFAVPGKELKRAAARLIPALKHGFPNIMAELTAIERWLTSGGLKIDDLVTSVLQSKEEDLDRFGRELEVSPRVLRFVFGQLVRPFTEKRAELIASRLTGFSWDKGYCPICGSWPSLSLLRAVEGERTLKCSFCAHEWRFARMMCPFCENNASEKLEQVFAEDRPFERAALCYKCEKYILELDLRQCTEYLSVEVAPLGMVHLDMLVQDKGFRPGAVTDWNVLDVE